LVERESLPRGAVSKKYTQSTVRGRIEAFLLDNVGRVVTRAMIRDVARDPSTGEAPENWHQRVSELRTDSGYRILTSRDDTRLKVSEYLLATASKLPVPNKRVRPTPEAWKAVLTRAGNACEWDEDGSRCSLGPGDVDPIGGGTVHLTPDHNSPHSLRTPADPSNPADWRALCGRHQVMKKNFWNSSTGRINYIGIIQAAKIDDKREVFEMLRTYFAEQRGFDFPPLAEPSRRKKE
jgi:hypothetical protein